MTKISNQYSLTNILTADLANSRLGINNVSPTVALDVTGAGKFSSSVSATSYNATTQNIFAVDGSEKMRITSTGDVGIGRTPTSKIDVYSATGNTFTKLESGNNSRVQFTAVNSINSANFGVESTAGATYTGTLANAGLFGSNGNYATQLVSNNIVRLTITGAGLVGIGTSSPDIFSRGYSNILGISGSTGDTGIVINGGTSSGAYIDLGTAGTRNMGIISTTSESQIISLNSIPLVLKTNGVDRLKITSGGNIGIGTSSPSYKLHVVGGTEVGSRFIVSGTYAPLQFSGDNSTTIGGVNAYGDKVVLGRGTSTGVNTDFVIFSNANTAIGTATDNGYKLYVSGTIYATGNITANSDLTLKKNLTIIDNPIDKLMQLNGYSYQWKEDDSHQYGVIAQEVEKILPYAVSTGNDGIKGVSYNQIIPVLIEAIKELSAEITILKNK